VTQAEDWLRIMTNRTTPAGSFFLTTLMVGILLLSTSLAALPAGGLTLQTIDLTGTPDARPGNLAIQRTPGPPADPPQSMVPGAGGNSVLFVENAGQWDPGARFQVWGGPAGTVWLAQDAIWIVVASGTSHPADDRRPVIGSEAFADLSADLQPADLQPATLHDIKLSFVDANPQPQIEGFDPQETVVSYFLGNDPEQWRPDVPVWGGVRYVDLYPGVDLELSGENGQMTPRLAARPGADLGAVRVRVEGADSVSVDGDLLRLSTAAGEVIWPLFAVNGIEGEGAQAEPSGTEAFDVAMPFIPAESQWPAANDTQRSPTDNPDDLLYGTFLGGNGEDQGWANAVDGAGSAYLTGYTKSSDFPTTSGAFDLGYNGGSDDVFVVKLNPAGSGLAYATFLGGSDGERGYALALDGVGNAYVTGWTISSDFPTTQGAFDPTLYGSGLTDAFVAKLNPTGGALTYATFLGDYYSDSGCAIAVDGMGSAYVTGYTGSSRFPTTPGAFDTNHNGGVCGGQPCFDAFVVKLNPAGSGLAYGTFLGGTPDDYGFGITVDGIGNAYVTGRTQSSNFPTTPEAFDRTFASGTCGQNPNTYTCPDTFVAKLNPTGSGLAYATFLGGGDEDTGRAIAVDPAGSAYVTGETRSTDFPTTPGAFDTSHNGGGALGTDTFVAKLNPAGSGLAYATFLGGSGWDYGNGIAVDGVGRAYVTGGTSSSNFPTTPGAFDPGYNGQNASFVVKMNPTGSGLAYATYLGGSGSKAIAVDASGSAYVTGYTGSSSFPTTPGAFDPNFNGGTADAFMVKLAMREMSATATPTATPTRTPTRTPTPMPPRGYVPLILHRWPRIPDAPMLNTITPPGANPSYTINWNSVLSVTSYVLQRATSASFADATEVYSGTGTSTNIDSQGIARYYYRVQARNQYGNSPWSNVQWVDVRWEQEPNYPLTNANGPLLSGLNYYGFPNDADDYFFFQVASRGQVTIDLTNHSATGVQLVLRNAAGERLAVDNTAPYRLEITVDPGRYYVHIYAADGYNSTTPYMLRAVFP
jgi:hypothetical protein